MFRQLSLTSPQRLVVLLSSCISCAASFRRQRIHITHFAAHLVHSTLGKKGWEAWLSRLRHACIFNEFKKVSMTTERLARLRWFDSNSCSRSALRDFRCNTTRQNQKMSTNKCAACSSSSRKASSRAPMTRNLRAHWYIKWNRGPFIEWSASNSSRHCHCNQGDYGRKAAEFPNLCMLPT